MMCWICRPPFQPQLWWGLHCWNVVSPCKPLVTFPLGACGVQLANGNWTQEDRTYTALGYPENLLTFTSVGSPALTCCISPGARVRSTMAMISPAAATVVAARPAQALGLPQLRVTRAEKLRCAYSKDGKEEAAAATPAVVKGVPLLAAASAAMTAASPALALVDERMSTEGTGLSLGLSNNLLGWILLGVFGLIWSLYTVYSSTLDDDDESGGLSL
ncbi:hypothetical protein CFC21_003343 [Triticum aestivum]|nr:hypothetical protein CFC21_003343 [Triticum aestivum]